MARNRKRAKERRARRPQPVASRSREGTARGGVPERIEQEPEAQEELEPVAPEPVEDEPVEDDEPDYEAPSPIEHAAPDAEIAEARLELGSAPELGDERALVDPELESEDDGRVYDDEVGDAAPPTDGAPSAGEVALPGHTAPRRRELPGNRLIGFLQGSWRELQRVQWPDRRQVFQATGVVIGFVIVAGVFLGVSDWVAGKVVSFVVNGHF